MKLVSLFILILMLTSSFNAYGEKPGDLWLQMSKSLRVSYLVGYVQGVDTGVDVADVYDGIMFEGLFNSSPKFRGAILKETTELYKDKENRLVDWKSMILLSYLELQGESKDIIEMRLRMLKESLDPYFGKKKIKQGDYWFQSSQGDRWVYLDGLIEGIQLGMHIEKQKDTRIITLFDGIFNLGEEIEAVADVVTEIVNDEANRKIAYRFLFPLAFMKYSKTEESVLNKFLKEIRKKMEKEEKEIKE